MLFGILLTGNVCAQADVVVKGIKMPAWIERAGVRSPVKLGMELQDADVLITGENARLLLESADGSDIKLGQQANLKISGLTKKRDEKSIFKIILDVTQGAFRFTTSSIVKSRERDVTVKIATATIGIRGTDVWGRDDINNPFGVVCLIEGKISVTGEDKKEFLMDQALSFYKMPKGSAALPVAPVDSEQITKWAAETEIPKDEGSVRKGGKWKINLITLEGQQAVLAAYQEMQTAGYDVKILPLENNQYRLRITSLASKAEAQALALQLVGKAGISAPQVTR